MPEVIVQVNKGQADAARLIVEKHGGVLERILRGTGDAGEREFHRVLGVADSATVVGELNASDAVAAAYDKPEAEGAASPDFEPRQTYLADAPDSLGIRSVWSYPGAKGAGVRIIDVEPNWNFDHEDIQNPRSVLLGGVTSTTNGPNHGTAVLSILRGTHNGIGVSGIVPAATVDVVSSSTSPGGIGSAAAIKLAADNLAVGDVLLLEIQRPGPAANYEIRTDQLGYIPIEWWPDDYEAIRFATSKGIVVVAPGANGQQNLDDPIYDTKPAGFPTWWVNPFRRTTLDSGSLIIGGGNPPSGTHGVTGEPGRSKGFHSNYGSAVDAQAWSAQVTAAGYGTLYAGAGANEHYTDTFGGTSAATALTAGCIGSLSAALKAAGRPPLIPAMARLAVRSTGTAQVGTATFPTTMRIGSQVNLKGLYDYFGLVAPVATQPTIVPTVVTRNGMNLGQLVDKVYQICGHDAAPTAQIEDMLNECQDEISRQIKAPTREVRKTVTGPFDLPEAEYNGILEIHSGNPGHRGGERVKLLTTSEASRYFPRWRQQITGGGMVEPIWEGANTPLQYVIYDPVNVSAPLVPMPGGYGSLDLFIKLHIRPKRMLEFDDYPLNGELPNSHHALYHYVCFQILMQRGDERSQAHYSFYKQLVDSMISDARPEPVFVTRETSTWSDWGEY